MWNFGCSLHDNISNNIQVVLQNWQNRIWVLGKNSSVPPWHQTQHYSIKTQHRSSITTDFLWLSKTDHSSGETNSFFPPCTLPLLYSNKHLVCLICNIKLEFVVFCFTSQEQRQELSQLHWICRHLAAWYITDFTNSPPQRCTLVFLEVLWVREDVLCG